MDDECLELCFFFVSFIAFDYAHISFSFLWSMLDMRLVRFVENGEPEKKDEKRNEQHRHLLQSTS